MAKTETNNITLSSSNLRVLELNLNIATVTRLIKEQRKMRNIYTRQGDLSVVANIEAHIQNSEEQLERYTAEYAAMINA